MMKKDCQEYTLIRLKDIKNDCVIRTFYTEDPLKYLKLYKYMQENDIDVDIDDDYQETDLYVDTIGEIKDIVIGFGGKYTFPYIDIRVEVRDYR